MLSASLPQKASIFLLRWKIDFWKQTASIPLCYHCWWQYQWFWPMVKWFKCPQSNLELLSTERERAWKLHHCLRSQLIHVQDNTEMLLIKCIPLKKIHFRSVYFLKSCYNILKNMTHFFMGIPLHLKDCSSGKGHFK